MTQHPDADLRDLSIDVLWEARQLCRLAGYIELRRHDGITVMDDYLDAAVLEAFVVHARQLIDFLWRDRAAPKKQRPRDDDGVAQDYFAGGGWEFPPVPTVLEPVRGRVGYAVVHLTHRRARREDAWGWDHAAIARALCTRLTDFAEQVPPARVLPGFAEGVRREVAVVEAMDRVAELTQMPRGPVGTPGFAVAVQRPDGS